MNNEIQLMLSLSFLSGRFKDLQFYTGESMDPDAMIIMVEYKDYQGAERPVLMFFKHGLEEEKC